MMRLGTGAIGAMLALACLWPIAAMAGDDAGWKALHARYTGFTFGDGKIRTFSATESVSSKGKPSKDVRWSRIGLLERLDTTDLIAHTGWSNGFTGNLFWYSDENGFTVPVLGEGAKVQLSADVVFSDALATLPWKIERNDTIDGVAYVVLRVDPSNGYAFEIFLDSKTGAYGRIVIDPKGDHETSIRILDYAEAGAGLRVPARWRIEDSNGDASSTLHDIAVNPTIPSDALRPPQASAHWTFGTGIVPIQLIKKRIVVHALVNGVPGTFLLDTGAQNIFLSGAFARRAGIQPMGHTKVYSLYGAQQNDSGRADTFAFGDTVLHDVVLYFGSPDVDDTAPDGLIGFDFFAGTVTTVDFERQTMHIEDAADPSAPEMGVAIDTDLSSGQPVVPMFLNKTFGLNVLLDTGSPEWLVIPDDLTAKYGLHMISENGEDSCGTLDDLSIGPIVDTAPYACSGYGTFGREALAGLDFLRQFSKIRFDYSRAIVEFIGRKKR